VHINGNGVQVIYFRVHISSKGVVINIQRVLFSSHRPHISID
jgi:hypothetical protein